MYQIKRLSQLKDFVKADLYRYTGKRGGGLLGILEFRGLDILFG